MFLLAFFQTHVTFYYRLILKLLVFVRYASTSETIMECLIRLSVESILNKGSHGLHWPRNLFCLVQRLKDLALHKTEWNHTSDFSTLNFCSRDGWLFEYSFFNVHCFLHKILQEYKFCLCFVSSFVEGGYYISLHDFWSGKCQ